MATHLDLLTSLIEQKLAKDLSRTTISEGIRVLDKRHKGELYCATCGNYEEWLRAEGNVFKKLLGFIRVTEYRSIDFSRQSAMMRSLCMQWRAMSAAMGGKRKSSEEQPPRKKLAVLQPERRPIWELSAAEVTSQVCGSASLSESGVSKAISLDEYSDSDSDSNVEMMAQGSGDVAQVLQDAAHKEPGGSGDDKGVLQDAAQKHPEQLGSVDEFLENFGKNAASKYVAPELRCAYYHDYGLQKMARTYASGAVEFGVEILEEDGPFLWFRWADGIEKLSEFPRKVEKVWKRPSRKVSEDNEEEVVAMEDEEEEKEEVAEQDLQRESDAETLPLHGAVWPEPDNKADVEAELQGPENKQGDKAGDASKEEDCGDEEGEEEEDFEEDFVISEKPELKLPDPSWQAGASFMGKADGSVAEFRWSNANGQGRFRITYAREQTYVYAITKDNFKLFFCGLSCKYSNHAFLIQATCSRLLALGEEHYEDLHSLKKMAVKIRDKLTSKYAQEADYADASMASGAQ